MKLSELKPRSKEIVVTSILDDNGNPLKFDIRPLNVHDLIELIDQYPELVVTFFEGMDFSNPDKAMNSMFHQVSNLIILAVALSSNEEPAPVEGIKLLPIDVIIDCFLWIYNESMPSDIDEAADTIKKLQIKLSQLTTVLKLNSEKKEK